MIETPFDASVSGCLQTHLSFFQVTHCQEVPRPPVFCHHGDSNTLHLRHGRAAARAFSVVLPRRAFRSVVWNQILRAQDTESFYTIVQQRILQRFGKEFTWELKAKMMGQKALAAAQTLVSELGLQEQLQPEDFVKEREEMLQTMFPEAKLLPGAAQLVKHLKANNVRSSATLQFSVCHLDKHIQSNSNNGTSCAGQAVIEGSQLPWNQQGLASETMHLS